MDSTRNSVGGVANKNERKWRKDATLPHAIHYYIRWIGAFFCTKCICAFGCVSVCTWERMHRNNSTIYDNSNLGPNWYCVYFIYSFELSDFSNDHKRWSSTVDVFVYTPVYWFTQWCESPSCCFTDNDIHWTRLFVHWWLLLFFFLFFLKYTHSYRNLLLFGNSYIYLYVCRILDTVFIN